jgi:hypothetical protein
MRDPTEGEALVAAGRKCRTDQCCDVYASSSKKAAALYTQAGDYQKTARFYYKKAEDTYYQVWLPGRRTCLALDACMQFLLHPSALLRPFAGRRRCGVGAASCAADAVTSAACASVRNQ